MLLSLSKASTAFWLGVSEWSLLGFGLILIIGLIGEHKGIHAPAWKAKEHIFSILVVLGVAGELFSDGGIFTFSAHLQTIAESETSSANERAGNAEKEAGEANNRAGKASERATANELQVAVLNSNNLALSSNVVELAHLYDESTNALAEAKVRLEAIRPLKDQLIDWFNNFDPSIIPALRKGKRIFVLNNVSEYRYNVFAMILQEGGIKQYVVSVTNTSPAWMTMVQGIGRVNDLTLELKPELAQ